MLANLLRVVARFAAIGAALSLGACGANYYSIYRHQPLGGDLPSATLLDAKQRAIIATRVPIPDETGGHTAGDKLVVCAEPSPDAFTVLAQAASGTGSFGKSADPASIQAAASFALTSSEQGSSFARTQTINMLREAMYRTCERYMDGAIGPLEMPIQAVRDQRMMVATLAIEQLTAAATPRVVGIGASGSASAGASASDAVVKLANAQAALATANTALKAKQSAADTLKDACAAIQTKVDAKQTLTADETTKQADCTKETTDLASAKIEQQTASQNLDILQKASAQGGGGPASATTSLQSPGEPGGAATTNVQQVASAVTDIVKANYDQDEVLLICLKIVGDTALKQGDPVRTTCIDLVKARIAASQAQAEADTAKAQAEKEAYQQQFVAASRAISTAQEGPFGVLWGKVAAADGQTVVSAKLNDLVDAYLAKKPAGRTKLEALKRQTTRDGLRDAFAGLDSKDQDNLGK